VSPHLYSLAQVVVAVSVLFVWVFRQANIAREFHSFGLGDLTRSAVGAFKVALATLLLAGLWFPVLVLASSVLMGLMMAAAQFFHARAGSPWVKRLPSLGLLALCVLLACR
jgi:uncharacterized membrane protein YkgB